MTVIFTTFGGAMGKDKLKRFREIGEMDHVKQPSTEEMLKGCDRLKGKWASEVFGNDKPIVLELACGKGEYTIGLAKRDPSRNFIGVDIKGARIWRGAKTAVEQGMDNVAFLRTRIDYITSFFAEDEVSEIWITFPDPQLKDRRARKRLTHPMFLKRYKTFLKTGGTINLKTDSSTLYDFTMDVIHSLRLKVLAQTIDVYRLGVAKFDDERNDVLAIRTYYEQMWLDQGKKIKYIRYSLDGWDGQEAG